MVTRTIGIVAGATAYAAVQRSGEQAALASGAAPGDAFLAGFEAAFAVAAGAVLLALMLGLVRPGIWWRAKAANAPDAERTA